MKCQKCDTDLTYQNVCCEDDGAFCIDCCHCNDNKNSESSIDSEE